VQSLIRPGVAMTTTAPSRRLNDCSPMARPPTIETHLHQSSSQNLVVSVSNFCDNSRVGEETLRVRPVLAIGVSRAVAGARCN